MLSQKPMRLGEDRVRWGILGTGLIAGWFAADLPLSRNGRLHAVASRDLAKARRFSEVHGGRPLGSYEALIDAPEIDAVHVHIEPLEPSLQAPITASEESAELHRALAGIVVELTGREPLDLRVHREPRGVVALVTVALDGGQTLSQAHAAATTIEAAIRDYDRQIVDVVVHTEPAEPLEPVTSG